MMQREQGTATSPARHWTILSLLDWAGAYLFSNGFDEARLHAELMLARALKLPRLDLYLQFDRPLTASELDEFKEMFKRRLRHEPLQYIVGETEFMGLTLLVDRNVLIPRPETELLVERALERIRSVGQLPVSLLEIGTGSGNIAVALGSYAPGSMITSIDVSEAALTLAARNIERHGLRNVCLERGDIFEDILPGRSFDIIVSNPPYVSLLDFAEAPAEVREFEPRIATTDEGDGLRFIQRVAEVAGRLMKAEGSLLMEIGYGQAEAARAILKQSGFCKVEFFDDFAGIPRVVEAQIAYSAPVRQPDLYGNGRTEP